jgi:hypothetical protein
MRRYLAGVVVILLCGAPLSAELKFTSKMSAKAIPGAAPSTDMMAAMIGPMMLQLFGGTEGIEMTTTIHEDGRMRVEYGAEFAGMPAGTVQVTRADGTAFGYDSKARTWWKVEIGGADAEMTAMLAQMKPEVTTKRTGEFTTVAGLRAERVSLLMVMPIPLPDGVDQLPPELLAMIPKEIRMEGDSWLSDAHAKYTKGMARVLSQGPLASMGLDKMMGGIEGLSVRQVMRMSMLAGYELETLMLKVAEEDVPDSVFDMPTGYKEIPMPTPAIR